MFERIHNMLEMGWRFECRKHVGQERFLAVFDRRRHKQPNDFCEAATLEDAVDLAYQQAHSWLNPTFEEPSPRRREADG